MLENILIVIACVLAFCFGYCLCLVMVRKYGESETAEDVLNHERLKGGF